MLVCVCVAWAGVGCAGGFAAGAARSASPCYHPHPALLNPSPLHPQERFPEYEFEAGEAGEPQESINSGRVQRELGLALTPVKETILDMVRGGMCGWAGWGCLASETPAQWLAAQASV